MRLIRSRLGAQALAWAVCVAWMPGCALDASSNPNAHCTSDTDCDPSQQCHRGFCVARDVDATTQPDSGRDTGPVPMGDAGRDAGIDAAMDAAIDAPAVDAGMDAPDVGMDAPVDMGIDTNPDADDWCDGAMSACTTGQLGECNAGHIECSAMRSCVRNVDPVPETCNDRDDDCDGIVDEEADARCYPPSPTIGCTRGSDGTWTCVGACRTGTQACLAGGNPGTCTGDVTPNVDGCTSPGDTSIDEDCDGMIDEDCTCTSSTMRSCFDGAPAQAGVGRCVRGSQTCDATGHWGSCVGSGAPMAETCGNTGSDDDCDGTVDNVPGVGVACSVPGAVGDCGDGMTQCVSGSMQCVAPTSTAEICDHHDNDCDGTTDEGFDLSSDDANCGACGTACGLGTSCCNGHCVDESSDAMACGACTMTCGAADTCCSSSCANTMNDPMNCGACGHTCSGGQLCCAGACVDPLGDAANCMTCGHACTGSADQCCGGACHAATDSACTGCPVACSPSTPSSTCCGHSCFDTLNDEANCGSCGHTCTSGQVCCNGVCETDDAAHCGGACANCGTGLCCGDTCVPDDTRHCQACGVSCATGQTCCGDGCHDLTSDAADCGTCGHACSGATPSCTNGHCCASGRTYCGSSCVDTANDSNNCGYCGHACGALSSCTAGSCHLL